MISVLVTVTVAVMKHMTQNDLGKKERLYSAYASRLQSIAEGNQDRKSRPGQCRGHGELLLSG